MAVTEDLEDSPEQPWFGTVLLNAEIGFLNRISRCKEEEEEEEEEWHLKTGWWFEAT